MADRKLRVLLKKIYSNGDKDTIFFKSRAKDVFIDEDGSTTLQDTVNKVNAIQSGATKVEDSNTNGNIKINGAETNVYTHPNSGVTAGTYNKVTVNAQGHVTSASNVTNWTGTVSGDISNATATFTTASSRANITSGANIKTTLGKIAKYFADLKSLAFVDKVGTANLDTTLTTAYNNRVTTDKVTTSTSITASGWVADARAIATLQNQINTINSNLNTKIGYQTIDYSNIDDIDTDGVYHVKGTVIGVLLHASWDVNYEVQLFHKYSDLTYSIRSRRGDPWTDWTNFSMNGHTHTDITNRINVISGNKISTVVGAINSYSDYNHWIAFHYTNPYTDATVPRVIIDGSSIYELMCWGKTRKEDNPSTFVLHSMFLDTSNRLVLIGSQDGQLVRRSISTISYTP